MYQEGPAESGLAGMYLPCPRQILWRHWWWSCNYKTF